MTTKTTLSMRISEAEKQELKRLSKSDKRSMASYIVHTLKLSKQSGKESKNG